ncbi:anti-sigma factor [uncultured Chloroflexus sp.]|uniref:anti-sigma factor n=1 Tax=uncultured Chloroflexus sp. TaxID=214040 RepID=UPI00263232A2|nr:anti-sigma factor [uncultured Chloroflexus sp.]
MEQLSGEPDEIVDLLAAYALDALAPSERARVQRLLAERPELYQTLTELRAAADLLPYGLDRPALPPEWRQRTIDYALGRRSPTEQSTSRQRSSRWRAWTIGLGSLSTFLLIVLLVLIGSLNSLRNELTIVTQQRDQSQSLAATAQASAQQMMAVLTNPTPLATLVGDAGKGAIFRDTAGNVFLIVSLPPLADHIVYQLWLIENNAAPVSGGIFTVDASGYGVIPLPNESARQGITLAITAEPAPGSPGPTGTIVIAGQIT